MIYYMECEMCGCEISSSVARRRFCGSTSIKGSCAYINSNERIAKRAKKERAIKAENSSKKDRERVGNSIKDACRYWNM